MAQTSPLDCPVGDYPNDQSKTPTQQIAGLLGHINDVHGKDLPQAVRDGITACKKELEKLELPV